MNRLEGMSQEAPGRLEVAGLSRRYGERPVLRDVNLSLQSGERVALLGQSGSGKSTLLRLIAGHELPDAGDVKLGGVSLLPLPPERRGIGMVFQSPLLFPGLSVRQNLEFGPRMAGVNAAERQWRVDALLDRTHLREVEGLRPHQLSGGQAQRAALARALAAQPRVLLLDEPLSALDAPLRLDLREWLASLLAEHGTTTLFVTHDREEAFALGQRLGVLHGGRLVQLGAPEELYRRPVSREVALLVGEGTLLAGTQHGQQIQTSLGVLTAQVPREGKVTVLLRPEEAEVTLGQDGGPLQVTAERVDFAGDRLRVHLHAGHTSLLATLPASLPLRAGDRLTVRLPPLWTFPEPQA